MINQKQELVSLLMTATNLPVNYELFIRPAIIPSISYTENDNVDLYIGDTMEYSTITYQLKVWAYSLNDISTYTASIDVAMKTAGYRRTFYQELNDENRIVAVIRYVATGYKR